MKLEEIKRIGPKTLSLFNKIKIKDTDDLIHYYPFRYNVIKRTDLKMADNNSYVVVDGRIETKPSFYRIKKNLDKLSFKLNTGSFLVNVTLFNRGFMRLMLKETTTVTITGKYDKLHNSIVGTDIRLGLIGNKIIIEPVYHLTYGLSKKVLKKYIDVALSDYDVKEYVPEYLKEKYHFMDKKRAIYILHNPSDVDELKEALKCLKYEELFVFMLKMNYLKNNKTFKVGLKRNIEKNRVSDFIDKLPFKLTDDQSKSVDEIYDDLISSRRMNRLLQGDVGSGKTLVAIIALYINYLSNYQGALMVPTEILARQHYENIKNMLDSYGVNVCLITSKIKAKERKEIYKGLENGSINIAIGTHALISEKVKYNNLGLVITDEQHRFGVNQRAELKNKGITPDTLYMSATPIPRTYALVLYGDMDISSIRTMPSGRKKIITLLKKETEIKDVLYMMLDELKKGHQIYVVAPLIDDSEKMDLENVNALYEKMNAAFGKLYKIGLLHGKMTNEEKEDVMNSFKNNDVQILVSTTVIEVGIDVKNATMMVIFDAFRFGLSALHQLRGRVGRNELQSYCVLISNYEKERLKIMTEVSDGFEIAEQDFRLRGSGDLFGYKQSGDMAFDLSDVRKDYNLLLQAKSDVEEFVKCNEDVNRMLIDEINKTLTDLD